MDIFITITSRKWSKTPMPIQSYNEEGTQELGWKWLHYPSANIVCQSRHSSWHSIQSTWIWIWKRHDWARMLWDRWHPNDGCYQTIKPKSSIIHAQEQTLDYIARREEGAGALKENIIKFAKEVLRLDMLPHVSMSAGEYTIKKAYFLGYTVHRMLNA